jgi:CO/xanthine dehydrogenase Mo-binding subunit
MGSFVVVGESSPFDDFAEPTCNTAQMLYACPNVETTYRLVRVNAMTPVFMRGVGQNSGCYAVESAWTNWPVNCRSTRSSCGCVTMPM